MKVHAASVVLSQRAYHQTMLKCGVLICAYNFQLCVCENVLGCDIYVEM